MQVPVGDLLAAHLPKEEPDSTKDQKPKSDNQLWEDLRVARAQEYTYRNQAKKARRKANHFKAQWDKAMEAAEKQEAEHAEAAGRLEDVRATYISKVAPADRRDEEAEQDDLDNRMRDGLDAGNMDLDEELEQEMDNTDTERASWIEKKRPFENKRAAAATKRQKVHAIDRDDVMKP